MTSASLRVQRLSCVEEEHARRLHAEGGSALVLAALLDIHVGGLDDADRVEAGVLEEALVFGRGDRLHQHLRDVVELHHAALLAAGPEIAWISCGSSWYWLRAVLSCSETICEILPSANLMTPGSWSK